MKLIFTLGQLDSQGDGYTNVPVFNAMAYWWLERETCMFGGFSVGQAERARLSLIPPFGPLFFYQLDQSNITYISGEVKTRVIITSEDRNFRIKPLTCE